MQTIETRPWPSSTVGYEPDGIDLTKDGHLLVRLGRANAVAVYRYDGVAKDPVSYIGLLPTDYYPADVASANGQIVVTNTRGIDARGPAITTYKGQGTVPVVRPRHAQHHRVPDPLHPAERPGHRARHRDRLRPERLGQERRPGGQGQEDGARPGPSAHR